jgi:hypothetical protein
MKVEFEKNIKESLENYELPYDPNAWIELSKKLDVSMPVSKKTFPKWGLYSSIISIVTLSSFLLFRSNNQASIVKNETSIQSSESKTKENFIQKNSTSENINSTKKTYTTRAIQNTKQTENTLNQSHLTNIDKTITPSKEDIINHSSISNLKINNFEPKKIEEYKKTNNTSSNNLENLSNNYSNNSIDFEIENELFYENGLPTIRLKAISFATNYEWTCEKIKSIPNSKEVDVHYFKKGTYSVKLSTTNQNGQISSESKKITINQDYNLLAVDAFHPTESNVKTNTFIPFALTLRNVKFTMTIVDSKNGGIMYQTSDVSQPWNGIDMRTGNLVDQNENCIWKVTIENPEPGENPIYKGVVIRL